MSDRRALSLVAALLLLGVAASAHADEASAEAAFREARRLMKEGRPAEACPQFEASYREAPALGALLNLAVCHQQIGRTASAYAEFRQVQEMARQRADSRETIARELADALAPRLTRLRIELVTPNAPSIVVYRNAVDVTHELDVSVPVDPGVHALEASAPGFVIWTGAADVTGEGQTVVVHVPVFKRAPVPVAALTKTSPAPKVAQTPPVPMADDPPLPDVRRAAAIGLGSAAAIAIGGALAAEMWGQARYEKAQTAESQLDADELVTAANQPLSTAQGLAVAGVGLAAASAYLWLTRDEPAAPDRRLEVTPAIGPGDVQAVLQGTF